MNTNNMIITFIAGLVVGGGGVWLLMGGTAAGLNSPIDLTKGVDNTSASSSDMIPTDQSGSVVVANQAAGDSVTIESVTVPPPGVWVAVRDVTDGQIGNILGAAHARGPISNFTVPLLRATVPGKTYAVVLYRDNGNDEFDVNGADSSYVDFDTGKPVIAPFETSL